MTQNKDLTIDHLNAKGRRSTISTSKIRKITVTKKNRNEKGTRAPEFGSNPHSKGELFSRFNPIFLANTRERTITSAAIQNNTHAKLKKTNITPSNTGPFDWKSNIQNNTKGVSYLTNKQK
jgi:hypothetical protein